MQSRVTQYEADDEKDKTRLYDMQRNIKIKTLINVRHRERKVKIKKTTTDASLKRQRAGADDTMRCYRIHYHWLYFLWQARCRITDRRKANIFYIVRLYVLISRVLDANSSTSRRLAFLYWKRSNRITLPALHGGLTAHGGRRRPLPRRFSRRPTCHRHRSNAVA